MKKNPFLHTPPVSCRACMGSSAVLLFFWAFLFCPVCSGPVYVDTIFPNFTAYYHQYIDNSGAGAFLASQARTFQARITKFKAESSSFYFVVVHVASNVIIWSANRNHPISGSSPLRLSRDGLTLLSDTGDPVWSTPRNLSSVSALRLLDSGNLVLLNSRNDTVWESFHSPTNVLVENQKLPAGKSILSPVREDDPSVGGYEFLVGNDDAILRWNGADYWRLSMERIANRDTTMPVEYMVMNFTGLYLIGNNNTVVVKVNLRSSNDGSANASNFWMVNLDHNGAFNILSVNRQDKSIRQKFPGDSCKIPLVCGEFGVCTRGGPCQCAAGFHPDPTTTAIDCVPADASLSLPGPCNSSSIKYLSLSNNLDYFSNTFTDPDVLDVDLSACKNLCSGDCSCFGVYYSNVSGSCYMIKNHFGSLIASGPLNRMGYVKTVANGNLDKKEGGGFPVLAVVLPSLGAAAVAVLAGLIWLRRRRRRSEKRKSSKFGIGKYLSAEDEEMDMISIPGLPVRFKYGELDTATGGFQTQIGSGGFGTVYKGCLDDGTEIAVKKITCLGARGNREFLAEIAVIGKIHHVNLVRLKGFCAHRGQRFLIYEYMNRGSLDRTLFHGEMVLQWRERYEIALGMARGLAYLHSGCENIIIHCDVKPENILLHDKSPVKISDFGLSKLLSTEESGLFTTMRGTRGYLAPEWLTSSAISDKTDVYSYGMVLLELIRGKKNSALQTHSNSLGSDHNMSSSPSSRESGRRLIYFPLFALEMHEERRYVEVVDPRLMGRVTGEEVEKLVRIALCCLHEESNLRPSMSNVVGMLEGSMPVSVPRIESLNFLRFYGRRFTEASVLAQNSHQHNELPMMAYREALGTTNTSSSCNSMSYMSSQQVSGPR